MAILGCAVTILCGLQQPPKTVIPVLTVCEALRNIKSYRGKEIAVVGRSAFTFEGDFISEQCEPDGTVMIQGHKWLTTIYLTHVDETFATQKTLAIDENLLQQKLALVRRSTNLTTRNKPPQEKGMFSDHWLAVVGRLESPGLLIPHRPPQGVDPVNKPGNGYGSNGSVPAKMVHIEIRELSSPEQ